MFERFTQRGRSALLLAQEEARSRRHEHMGTEHILLGVLRESGDAASALGLLGVTLNLARAEVEAMLGRGERFDHNPIPFTANAKFAVEKAVHEALLWGEQRVDPEHILLALQHNSACAGARILRQLGADPASVRSGVIDRLTRPGARFGRRAERGVERGAIDPGFFDELGGVFERVGTAIHQELGRAPDSADLLLLLGSIPHTPLAHVLTELGVDPDRLRAVIKHSRQQVAGERAHIEKLYELRQKKQQAIAKQDFPLAANLRDQEQALVARIRATYPVSEELIRQILDRLGVPNPAAAQPG